VQSRPLQGIFFVAHFSEWVKRILKYKGLKKVVHTFSHDKNTLLNVYVDNMKIETTNVQGLPYTCLSTQNNKRMSKEDYEDIVKSFLIKINSISYNKISKINCHNMLPVRAGKRQRCCGRRFERSENLLKAREEK